MNEPGFSKIAMFFLYQNSSSRLPSAFSIRRQDDFMAILQAKVSGGVIPNMAGYQEPGFRIPEPQGKDIGLVV